MDWAKGVAFFEWKITLYQVTQYLMLLPGVIFPPLSQLKLVLNIATLEGWKDESTWMLDISKIDYPRKAVTYLTGQ